MRLYVLSSILACAELSGQEISVRLLDGNDSTLPLESVRRLEFVGDSVRVLFDQGTYSQWNTNDIRRNDYINVGPEEVLVAPRLFLDGPFVEGAGLMHDSLRVKDLIPVQEPYSDLGFSHIGCGGNEITLPSVLERSGDDAIVDWLFIELWDSTQAVHTRSALLQRDGEVVDVDGVSPVVFYAPKGWYRLVVRHRNHLAVAQSSLFYANGDTAVWDPAHGAGVMGTDAMRPRAGVLALWTGDIVPDDAVKYTGTGNDRDPVLVRIGGTIPTASASGYLQEDVTMDGWVRYTGTGNDRDPILVTVGGTVPTNIRHAQLPTGP